MMQIKTAIPSWPKQSTIGAMLKEHKNRKGLGRKNSTRTRPYDDKVKKFANVKGHKGEKQMCEKQVEEEDC